MGNLSPTSVSDLREGIKATGHSFFSDKSTILANFRRPYLSNGRAVVTVVVVSPSVCLSVTDVLREEERECV